MKVLFNYFIYYYYYSQEPLVILGNVAVSRSLLQGRLKEKLRKPLFMVVLYYN